MTGRVIFISICTVIIVWVLGMMFTGRSLNSGAGGDAAEQAARVFTTASYAEARETASSSDRLFVVHVGAEWCGPCQMMDAQTWRDPKVEAWISANAVAAKIDSDHQPDIARELGVQFLPTIVAFHGGREVGRLVGFNEAGEFTSWLDSIKPAGLAPQPIGTPVSAPAGPGGNAGAAIDGPSAGDEAPDAPAGNPPAAPPADG